LNLQDARRLVTRFVEHYNTVRLHSAIGYITPADKLAGKEEAIFAARDQKLLQARETPKTKRNQNNAHTLAATLTFSNSPGVTACSLRESASSISTSLASAESIG
jgi:Integrase core domain